jgi:putative signal transducing protein
MSIKGWTVIFKGQRLQAELLAAILEADGVRAEVFGDTPYGVAIDMTDARLLVPDDQAGHARRLIKEAEEAGREPPEEESEEGV